jgi:hypothetical protein
MLPRPRAVPANKQLERTVIRRRVRAASALFHYALAARWTAQRAAAQLRSWAATSMFRRVWQRVVTVVLLIPCGAFAQSAAPDVEWRASHDLQPSGTTKTVLLGDGAESIALNGGWVCGVAETSKQLPAYEARQVACRKGGDVVEFSVQCEPARPKDHAQLRFRNSTEKVADFFEVSCELK